MSLPLVFHPDYDVPLPNGHRFPMSKFALLHRYLLDTGLARPRQFHRPDDLDDGVLHRVHAPAYVRAFDTGTLDDRAMRRIGLPWSARLARRSRIAVAGTVRTVELAVAHGLACNTAGGTHHAFADVGTGFCIYNDLAVAAVAAVERSLARRVMIVDLDVHQGDGTAALLAGNPATFTFSMHCQSNFPLRKMVSDHDVALPDGLEDAAYLAYLRAHLESAMDRFDPDLVLYDAGVDPHREDRLGRLNLTDAGLAERDRYVIELCLRRGIPIACVIGGGYAADHRHLAERHAILHRTASRLLG